MNDGRLMLRAVEFGRELVWTNFAKIAQKRLALLPEIRQLPGTPRSTYRVRPVMEKL
jgi:hypothetical protein